MDRPRTPFLLIAFVLFLLVVAIEIGAGVVLDTVAASEQALASQLTGELREEYEDFDDEQRADLAALREKGGPPGIGIPYMALIDGVLLYIVFLITLGVVMPERVQGRIQGLATLILSILLILGSILLALAALALLLVMIGLLLAVPFGTIAYMARFGFFNTGAALAALGTTMMLKLFGGGLLVAAHQRFLQNKWLIFLVILSVVANIVLAFLHGFPPGFLASITDAVGAIVFAIVAIILGIFFLIGALVSVIKAVRVDRGLV
jgi:hypothetical protein